jgi:hypothetical protein
MAEVFDFEIVSVGAAIERLEAAMGGPVNFAIAQGAEGELWVATAGGLYAAGFTPAAALVALVKLAERGVCDE